MLRLNRGRVIGIFLTGFIIYFLFLSSAGTSSDFRKRTEEGLSRRHGILQGDLSDEAYREQTNQKLHDILLQKGQQPFKASDGAAGPAAANMAPTRDEDDEDVTGVAGRKTMQKPKDKPKYPVDRETNKQDALKKAPQSGENDEASGKKKQKPSADPGKDIARQKLQEYMKKPLVIFSKSYCPHSKSAKHLLLDLYKIVPAPLVVELDQLSQTLPLPHSDNDDDNDEKPQPPTLGATIQSLLADMTGRRTVPNIVVGTTSIGGNDLLWEMHEMGTLADRIKELGGKRILSVDVVDEGEDGEAGKRKRHGGTR